MEEIRIVTGGLFGSEGKGAFIDEIADRYGVHIRVGGPQAGHSIKRGDTVYKLTTVPVGAFTPGTVSVIGPMSVVDLDALEREMEWAKQAMGRYPIVIVDPRATVLDEADIEAEKAAKMSDRLGSTQHGVGAARQNRIARTAETIADRVTQVMAAGAEVQDTIPFVRNTPQNVLIEAAQGQLLSLFTSGHYPYCTSSECGPSQALIDAGFTFQHALLVRATGVFRTFPIRVGGNSGDMGGHELDWESLRLLYGDHIPVERTTVTNKIRRVSTWDPEQARASVVMSGIDDAVLSFVDYPFPEVEGTWSVSQWSELPHVHSYVQKRATELGVPIVAAGTSFGTYVHHTWNVQG